MKRSLITFLFALAVYTDCFSQTMQASIGPGTTSTRVKIYIRPTGGLNINGNISTFQFNLAIAAGINPVPTLSFVGVPAFGSGWQIDPSYTEDLFRHYQINSTTGGNLVLNNLVELQVMELEFSGGPVTANNVALYTLPNEGGSSGNALFLCTGDANSSSVAGLYYIRGGVTVVNNNSYAGGLPSSATIGGILLPIRWLSFDAVKQNNNALLSWAVSNEDANKNYELQRSINGNDFSTIATINKNGTGNGIHDYSYTDFGINTLGSPVIYYRIKQVDIDSRYSFSEIKKINLNLKTDIITVYPNPVKDGFYVVVPGLQATTQRNIKLILTNNAGQVVQTKEISPLQAANYYFDVKGLLLATGIYSLQIIQDGISLDRKQLLISK